MSIKNNLVFALLVTSCTANTTGHRGRAPVSQNQPAPDDRGNSAPAQQPAGTITSSGGYLYGFETNPWFLENTAEVKYCIDMDEQNFGVSRSTAKAAIVGGIEVWKRHLSTSAYAYNPSVKPFSKVMLGTQAFAEVTCDDSNVLLRFQLGKLTSDQYAKMGHPLSYVAGAFETAYDEENMRGKGFIYIAPESGPFRPQANDLRDAFWNSDGSVALQAVIVHELGHVFGFGHVAGTIMSESVPQSAVSKATNLNPREIFRDLAALSKSVNNLLGPSDDASRMIHDPENLKGLFGKKPADLYILQRHKLDSKSNTFVMYEASFDRDTGEFSRLKPVGEVQVATFETKVEDGRFLKVKLPINQKVFFLEPDPEGQRGGATTLGASVSAIGKLAFEVTGVYKSYDGKIAVPVRITTDSYDSKSIIFEAVIDNKIVRI